ncbi:MAG: ribosome assembly cofactor RimP [Paludibacteraceae bacterium]|nr:ribosome assembly cofactor RimP [Paludibacteraceae bacterium]
MILKDTVNQIIESHLASTDHYLVDLKISNDNRIQVEVDSFEGVAIDFCVDLSKHIESQLDREAEDFELEVSSAGLTEPFKVLKQYEKNIGNEVEVLTLKGQKHNGILSAASPESFSIDIEKSIKPEGAKRKTTITETLVFNYQDIKHTKYIIRFK